MKALQTSGANGQENFFFECSSKLLKALKPELYLAQVAFEMAEFRTWEN